MDTLNPKLYTLAEAYLKFDTQLIRLVHEGGGTPISFMVVCSQGYRAKNFGREIIVEFRNLRKIVRRQFTRAFLIFSFVSSPAALHSEDRPNVLLILVDDAG